MKKATSILIIAMFLISFASAQEWEFIQIKDLKEGDILMDKDGNEVLIKTIEKVNHYYFADNKLVHNSERENKITVIKRLFK